MHTIDAKRFGESLTLIQTFTTIAKEKSVSFYIWKKKGKIIQSDDFFSKFLYPLILCLSDHLPDK